MEYRLTGQRIACLVGGAEQMITKERIQILAESECLYRKGCELYYEEDYERAFENLEEAVLISPNFSSALCVMGHCREKQGQEEEALELYTRAIEADPYHSKAWYYKGEALIRLGRTEEGQKHIAVSYTHLTLPTN